jgi:hypothetical protein
MRLALLIAVALAVGCDDPAASDLATSVLTHGSAAARIVCSTSFSGLIFASPGVDYTAAKLQDGACIASVSGNVTRVIAASSSSLPADATAFIPRNETGADTCTVKAGGEQLVLSASDGNLTASPCTGSGTACVRAIDAVCTGFNLEAFGVDP